MAKGVVSILLLFPPLNLPVSWPLRILLRSGRVVPDYYHSRDRVNGSSLHNIEQ